MHILWLFLTLPSLSAPAPPAGHRNAGIGGGGSASAPAAIEYAARTLLTPAEFDPATELQLTAESFRRMMKTLAGTVDRVAGISVLVSGAAEGRSLSAAFQAAGGDSSRLQMLSVPYDSFWYQDFGPIYSLDGAGGLVSNDFRYNRYNRRNDDAVPARLGELQGVPNRAVSMDYEGGNFISDGKGGCFASSRIYQQNPQLSREQVNRLMEATLGCRKLTVLTPLLDDITYHIDLFAKMIDERSFLVGDFVDHPRNKAIMDRNAATLQALGYSVHRIPVRSPERLSYLTHINSFLLNGFVLLPVYGIPEDRTAAALYSRLGFRVLEIEAGDLASSGGAIHCILRSKPRVR